jgi:error-prone DNA polymerase
MLHGLHGSRELGRCGDGVDRETPAGACRAHGRWRNAAHCRGQRRRARQDDLPAYAELHCLSDFSFLRGAASAEELFERAHAICGYEALAITDECSLAGIVRGLEASRATGLPLIVGSEFVLAAA